MMETLLLLFDLALTVSLGASQCYNNEDISIHQIKTPPSSLQAIKGEGQCLANNTLINENNIDDDYMKGINCSKKDSTAINGTWRYDLNGSVVECDENLVTCKREPGSITLYTVFNDMEDRPGWPEGKYTCCIEGLCISIRLYQDDIFGNDNLFPNGTPSIESCNAVPPIDIGNISQKYLLQMVTTGIPPTRLISFINCTNSAGITCGKSYYTLIDSTEEKYQLTVPVTWNTDDTSDIPNTISHEEFNGTAVTITWSTTGNVNGFFINITSNGLDNKIEQLTDSSVREFVINGLLPETEYTVQVRGYYELLGPAETTTLKLDAGISSVNGSLLSVSNDLSTQQIQVNCYTFRVKPSQVAWRIGLPPDSRYQAGNGSELLDTGNQTYRHYIILNGSFSAGTAISCSINVNGESTSENYELQAPSPPPNGLSATITSTTSLSISWTSSSNAMTGYIVDYNGGQPVVVEETNYHVLNGLSKGNTYQINVYSYNDVPSETFTDLTVDFGVPLVMSFEAQPNTPTTISISWVIPDTTIIDNYTVTITRFCDNVVLPSYNVNGGLKNTVITGLSSGLEYTVGIVPVNILGEGMEMTDIVTVQENGPPSGAPLLQPVVTINSTAIRLSWEEVNCTERNGVITGYIVQYNNTDGAMLSINVADVASTVIAGLSQFRLYTVRVAALNNNGIGQYSNAEMVYTIDTTVNTPTISPSLDFVQLSWQFLPSINNVTYEYEVAYSVNPQCTDNRVSLPNGHTLYSPRTSSNSTEVFGLMSGTCYVFGVRAYTLVTNSPGEFSVINGVTVSEVVNNLLVKALIFSVQLSWNPLPSVAIDELSYEIGFSPIQDCSTSTLTLPHNYTTFMNTSIGTAEVTGLDPSTCYVFGVRVYSTMTGQLGEWTISVNNLHPRLNVTSYEQTLTVSVVTLSWSPLVARTDDIFIYEVGYIARPDDTQCTDSNTLPEGFMLFGNTTGNSIVVTELQPKTCYVFGVRVFFASSHFLEEWIVLQKLTAQDNITSACAVTGTFAGTAGLVAGLVALSVIILLLLMIIVVQNIWIWSRQDKSPYSTVNKNIQIKSAVYEVPDITNSTDDIEMKECELYGLHQVPCPQSLASDETHIYEVLQQQQ